MFSKKITFTLLFLLSFFLSSLQNIFACSCAARPTVLDSFEDSELVVITQVIAVEKFREKDGRYDIGHIKSAKMVVEKVYKGNVKAGDELVFAQGGGADCIWTFDEESIGDKILFYLGSPTTGHPLFGEKARKYDRPMYSAVICGRSNGVNYANDDLLYLDNLSEVRGKTRISGKLYSWTSDGPSFTNVKIKIIGKDKIYETKTDKNGVYEIYDLPAGEYLIEPDIPKGWKIDDYMLEQYAMSNSKSYELMQRASKNQAAVILEEKRHAAMDLTFEIDNAITGKVFSPIGEPMYGVCVKAVSTQLADGDFRGKSDCTNEEGEFEINEVYPGNYILVLNDDGKPSAREPFGTLFYPGVSDRKQAGVISIDVGKFINNINIQIPKTERLIEVTGRFLYSDGFPVTGEWVKFIPIDKNNKINGEERSRSDEQGRFSIKVLKGMAGNLIGEMTIYKSEFENCPHISKLIKVVGQKTWTDVQTEVFKVNAEKDIYNVELKLPFASCRKAKK